MPLRLRLALWYGALTGVVALLVSLVTYAEHTRAHYDDIDGALVGAVEHLIGREPDDTLAQGDLQSALAAHVEPSVALRVYDGAGRELAAGPNADLAPRVDPRTIRPAQPSDPIARLVPPVAAGTSGVLGLAMDADGPRWRVYVQEVDADQAYVVALSPLDRIDSTIDGFRGLMLVGGLLGATTTFVFGSLLAGRALRPVTALTEAARSIARSREFDERVPIGPRRDELGRLATTFNEMLASLDEAYAAQQRFVSDASHELRAPLTVIQGNLELLASRPELTAGEREEALHEASRETRRLTTLVADLLALARGDAGTALRRERVELDRVLLDTVDEARHLTDQHHLEIGAIEPTTVLGDFDRLKQLVLILIDNAIKYTPAGGRVTVALHQVGELVELSVDDTGIGISSEDQAHVFERFYRADPMRSRDPGGSGLGLSIALWIAQQHGGDIVLESQPGQGTRAIVQLPVAR